MENSDKILETKSESRRTERWISWISFQISGIYPPNRVGLKILIILLQVEKRTLIVHGCILAIQIQKIVTFSPNKPLVRSTELSDSIWYIWVFLKKKKKTKKTNKYSNIGWLLLMSLGKVVQEDSELRNSISQLKGHREDLRDSLNHRRLLSLVSAGLQLLKIKRQLSPINSWITKQVELPALQGIHC